MPDVRVPAFVLALALVAAQTGTPTHWVTPTGSPSSACTLDAPCTLARAAASLPAGSVVSMAAGLYGQPPVTLARSGLRFVGDGDVRLVGTRDKPATWTPTPGMAYVFETPWTAYPVATVAQRPPVSTWRSIHVDDRATPGGPSQGRPFDLDFPIRYTARSSVAQVDAQSCTWVHTGATVYVHMCHDGPPVDADELYLGSAGWGAVIVDGDDDTLEHVTLEQVSGTALKLTTSADRTTLRHVRGLASQVWLEGKGTLAEDLEVGYVIAQGVPGPDCADANPDFGLNECWQGAGKGDALLIGHQGSTLFFNQTIRRAWVHHSWNGARLDGYNTLEDSKFQFFPNHTLQASGPGVTLRRNVFLAGQDSLYLEGLAFDRLTAEHNIFVNGVLVWASRDGQPVGPAPSLWTFRYNLLAAIVLDDRTAPVAVMDCNVYMPSSPTPSHLLKITSTTGGLSTTYRTLAQVKAGTVLEARSVERPSTWWTGGPLFVDYTGQSHAFVDFSDPLRVCGERAGI